MALDAVITRFSGINKFTPSSLYRTGRSAGVAAERFHGNALLLSRFGGQLHGELNASSIVVWGAAARGVYGNPGVVVVCGPRESCRLMTPAKSAGGGVFNLRRGEIIMHENRTGNVIVQIRVLTRLGLINQTCSSRID